MKTRRHHPADPDIETMLAYRDGGLSEVEQERVRRALVADPWLAARYLELEDSTLQIEDLAPASVDVDAAWQRFAAGPLTAEESGAVKKPELREPSRILGLPLHSLGWAVAATLCLAGSLWLARGPAGLDATLGEPIYEVLEPGPAVERGARTVDVSRSTGAGRLILALRPPAVAALGFELPPRASWILSLDGVEEAPRSTGLQDEGIYLVELALSQVRGRETSIRLVDPSSEAEIGTYHLAVAAPP